MERTSIVTQGARINAAFQSDVNLDCLFMNVEPFGKAADGTRYNQGQAVKRILDAMNEHPEDTVDILYLHSNLLFAALLDGIPMAFQRVAIKREQLQKVGLYGGKGFEDLEWYYRVALRCTCGLLVAPGYRVRCDGQSYFSRPEEKQRLIDTTIHIRKELLKLGEVISSPFLTRTTKKSVASAHFNKAYYAYQSNQSFPWRNFFESMSDGLSWRHLSLAGKILKRGIHQSVVQSH